MVDGELPDTKTKPLFVHDPDVVRGDRSKARVLRGQPCSLSDY
jgi:hypothetical protein